MFNAIYLRRDDGDYELFALFMTEFEHAEVIIQDICSNLSYDGRDYRLIEGDTKLGFPDIIDG